MPVGDVCAFRITSYNVCYTKLLRPYGGDDIIINNGFMRERIPIRSMRRLSDEELDEVYVRFGIRPPAVVDTEDASYNFV